MESARSAAFIESTECLSRRESARIRRHWYLGGSILLSWALGLGGCAPQYGYVNDGRSLVSRDVQGLLESASDETRTVAFVPPQFPIVLAVARVQRGRPLRALPAVGRDGMSEEDLGKLAALPHVRKVAPLTIWEREPNAGSVAELRAAARRLNADMLLVYELTTERTPTGTFPLVGFASLGVIPDSKEVALGNAAAMLIDVRTSYQYATLTAQGDGARVSNYWGRAAAWSDAQTDARRETMGKLVERFASSWQEIASIHHPRAGVTPVAASSTSSADAAPNAAMDGE